MAELAEGARLLSEYGGKLPSRVRIPVSPPFYRTKVNLGYLGLAFFHAYISCAQPEYSYMRYAAR